MISFVTPTFDRHHLLPFVYDVFCSQTCADKELVILDDSPGPSSFMQLLSDERVQYIHAPRRLPIGAKRDMLAVAGAGERRVG